MRKFVLLLLIAAMVIVGDSYAAEPVIVSIKQPSHNCAGLGAGEAQHVIHLIEEQVTTGLEH